MDFGMGIFVMDLSGRMNQGVPISSHEKASLDSILSNCGSIWFCSISLSYQALGSHFSNIFHRFCPFNRHVLLRWAVDGK